MMNFETFMNRGSVRLDSHQQAVVYCDDNCVVSAGAGSGKTMVLSYRFLRLVLERKAKADEILTLTFTRKAAKEMQSRIHAQLLSCKDDPEIAAQVASFGEASIATLDSFCSSIVQADSMHYGIVGDFAIDDEGCKQAALRAAHALLDQWPQSRGAQILSTLYTPDRLVEEVLVPLATRFYPLPQELGPESLKTIVFEAERQSQLVRAELIALLQKFASLADDAKTVVEVASESEELLTRLMGTASLEEELTVVSSSFGHRRKPSGKRDDLIFLNEMWPQYIQLRLRLSALLALLVDQDRLADVHAFMAQYLIAVQRHKRESGTLTFSDVASLAVDILKRNKILRQRYKERYRYIMIDEFQDNNELQKQLLYLLAEDLGHQGDGVPRPEHLERGKLFFVGDEKQSIYRFRGADVSVFKALGEEMRSIGGKEFTLNTNYRSEPALIEWFNGLFDTVMANEGESWEADFTTLGTRSPTEGINASIKLMIKAFTEAEEDEAKSSDAEALAIADLVEKMLVSDSYLIPSREGPRRPKPSDIALLMRTTGNQLSFEKALRRKKIPYSVQAARSLMLEALANDCYAMLQLALYPEDTLSYLVVLRSPFCNLNDDSIVRLSHAELFSESVELEEAERRRLMRCKAFYERLRSLLGSRSLSELVQMIFYESGYYLHLVSRAEYQVYMEHYTFLHRLAQMHQQMGRSVSQFVDYLRQHLGTAEKIDELEVIKEQESGVQIMSIHKSKGLEFPIVIVADTGSRPMADRDIYSTFANVPLPHYLDRQAHETLTKQITIRHAGQLGEREVERARSVAELKRLLYVALTRSETHLVFSGCFTKANRSLSDDGAGDTLLLQLCRALGISVDDPHYEGGIVTTDRIEPALESSLYETGREKDSLFLQRVARMRHWYQGARALPPVQPIRVAATRLRPSLSVEEGIPLAPIASDAILSGSEELAMAFGTLVHALIENRFKGELGEIERLLEPLNRLASAHDVHLLTKDAVALADRFFASEFYRTEVAPYSVSSEVAFFHRVKEEERNIIVEGVMDLVVDQQHRMLIVDFKSDSMRFIDGHRGQLSIYTEAATRLYEKKSVGCIIYLREPSLVEIWE